MALTATQTGTPEVTGSENSVTVTVAFVARETTDPTFEFSATASADINPGAGDWETKLRNKLTASIDAQWAAAKRAWARHVYVTQTLAPQVDSYLAGLE